MFEVIETAQRLICETRPNNSFFENLQLPDMSAIQADVQPSKHLDLNVLILNSLFIIRNSVIKTDALLQRRPSNNL